jgi:hypothetical protein
MKKAIFIDESKSAEIVTYSKISEYVSGSKSLLCDNLSIYSTDDSEETVTINDCVYGLPALIIPKAKMNNYDLEALLSIFENLENDNEITINDDDFFVEEDEDDEEESSEYEEDNSDWY